MINFQSEKRRAETMRKLETDPAKQDYLVGYLRGLRRTEFGDNFGTEEEHNLWLSLFNASDSYRRERGRGYKDGLKYGKN